MANKKNPPMTLWEFEQRGTAPPVAPAAPAPAANGTSTQTTVSTVKPSAATPETPANDYEMSQAFGFNRAQEAINNYKVKQNKDYQKFLEQKKTTDSPEMRAAYNASISKSRKTAQVVPTATPATAPSPNAPAPQGNVTVADWQEYSNWARENGQPLLTFEEFAAQIARQGGGSVTVAGATNDPEGATSRELQPGDARNPRIYADLAPSNNGKTVAGTPANFAKSFAGSYSFRLDNLPAGYTGQRAFDDTYARLPADVRRTAEIYKELTGQGFWGDESRDAADAQKAIDAAGGVIIDYDMTQGRQALVDAYRRGGQAELESVLRVDPATAFRTGGDAALAESMNPEKARRDAIELEAYKRRVTMSPEASFTRSAELADENRLERELQGLQPDGAAFKGTTSWEQMVDRAKKAGDAYMRIGGVAIQGGIPNFFALIDGNRTRNGQPLAVPDRLADIKREFGSVAAYRKAVEYTNNITWDSPEWPARLAGGFVRGYVNQLVSSNLKGLDLVDKLTDYLNPLSYAADGTGATRFLNYLPVNLRGMTNILGFTVASLLGKGREFEAATQSTPVDKRLFYTIGDEIEKSLGDDPYLKETVGYQLAQGLGSAAGFLTLGLLAPEASIATRLGPLSLSSGAMGALSQAGSAYSDAKKQGLDESAALFVGAMNLPNGASEMFGVGSTLGRALGREGRATFWREFARFLREDFVGESIEEGLQEFMQTTAGAAILELAKDKDPNIVNKLRNSYDRLPAQMRDAVPQALIAAATGGIFGISVGGSVKIANFIATRNQIAFENGETFEMTPEQRAQAKELKALAREIKLDLKQGKDITDKEDDLRQRTDDLYEAMSGKPLERTVTATPPETTEAPTASAAADRVRAFSELGFAPRNEIELPQPAAQVDAQPLVSDQTADVGPQPATDTPASEQPVTAQGFEFQNRTPAQPVTARGFEFKRRTPPAAQEAAPEGAREAVWRNKDADQPITVTGEVEIDGRKFYTVEGSKTGIPADEVTFPTAKPATSITPPASTQRAARPVDVQALQRRYQKIAELAKRPGNAEEKAAAVAKLADFSRKLLADPLMPSDLRDRILTNYEQIAGEALPADDSSKPSKSVLPAFEPLKLPKAADTVGGLTVGKTVPNTSSIPATLTNYEELPGIREISFDELPSRGRDDYATTDDRAKVDKLVGEIRASGEIAPMIVVQEANNDAYVLEGGHRHAALKELGVTSFPALVVRDLDGQGPLKSVIAPEGDASIEQRTNFNIGAERGQREIGDKAGRVTAEERAKIETSVKSKGGTGVNAEAVLGQIRSDRQTYAPSVGWTPLVPKQANKKTSKSKGTTFSVKYQEQPYGYNRPPGAVRAPAKNDPAWLQSVAGEFTELIRDLYRRQKAGDPVAAGILTHIGWYKNVAQVLRQQYGGFGAVLADLLGATSPNTPVSMNWKFSVDILNRFLRGEFAAELAEFGDAIESGRPITNKEYPNNYKIRQVGQALYGMNSLNAMKALVDVWNVIEPNAAPKARNFALNLLQLSHMATIDVWAARMIRRAANQTAEGKGLFPRIPPPAEKGVAGKWNASGTDVTGEYGFGAAVMAQAAETLRAEGIEVDPEDLQAIAWFAEKELWTRNGWTTAEGEGGSFEAMIQDSPVGRWLLGVSVQQDAPPARSDVTDAQSRMLDTLRGDELVVAHRAEPTFGLYDETVERSFDVEFVTRRAALIDGVPATEALKDDALAGIFNAYAAVPTASNWAALRKHLTDLTTGSNKSRGKRAFKALKITREQVSLADFDPTAIVQTMVALGQQHNQTDVFISRALDPHEENGNARPGVELIFESPQRLSEAKPILDDLRAKGFDGFTMIVDPRLPETARKGTRDRQGNPVPRYIGVRLQYIPEFEARWGDREALMKPGALEAKIAQKTAEMDALIDDLLSDERIVYAHAYKYDTLVIGKERYDEYAQSQEPGGRTTRTDRASGSGAWPQRSVRENVEAAIGGYDRQQGQDGVPGLLGRSDTESSGTRQDQEIPVNKSVLADGTTALREYATRIGQADPRLKSIQLVGSTAAGTASPNDTDLLYEFQNVTLPEDTGEAESTAIDLLESAGVESDRASRDTLVKVGDRYFFLATGAGVDVVENSEYGRAQAGRPAVVLYEAGANPVELSASKSAIPNTDMSEKARARVSGTGFYSAVEQAILEKMPARATADQVRGILNPAKTPGIKQEELDWLDIESFLKNNPRPTKPGLLDYVRLNTADVREVVKGKGQQAHWRDFQWSTMPVDGVVEVPFEDNGRAIVIVRKEDGFAIAESDRLFDTPIADGLTIEQLSDELDRIAGNVDFDNVPVLDRSDLPDTNPTKFSEYQLPGKRENYRELLLTFPAQNQQSSADRYDELTRIADRRDLTDAEQQEMEAIERAEFNGESGTSGTDFRSGHFPEPNILAHIRFNERTDADGAKVLFIEEIQSDWAQKGRVHGFRSDQTVTAIWRGGVPSVGSAIYDIVDSSNNTLATIKNARSPENALADYHAKRVPDMPFKSTPAWSMLAFKRALRWAVENGFDKVAWTTGEQQIDRYDDALRSNVDVITWQDNGDGTVRIIAAKDGDNKLDADVPLEGRGTVLGKTVSLDDVVGKNLAGQIRESLDDGFGEFTGSNLSIGGDGMKGFYDRILPAQVNKYVKKWGGKVEQTTLVAADSATQQEAEEIADDVDLWEEFIDPDNMSPFEDLSYEERLSIVLDVLAADAIPRDDATPVKVHALTITPILRDSVAHGQPLYKLADDETIDPKTVDEMRALRFADLDALLTDAARIEVVGRNVKLSPVSQEIIRRAQEQVELKSKRKSKGDAAEDMFAGIFLAKPQEIVDVLREAAATARENGYSPEEIAVFERHADAIEQAARMPVNRGTVVAFVFDSALSHEVFHQTDYLAAIDKSLMRRHSDAAAKRLDAHPIAKLLWDRHFSRYNDYTGLRGDIRQGILRSEIPPFLLDRSDAELAKLGITPAMRDDYLLTWFEGYAEKNGIDALDSFGREELDVQTYISQVKESRTDGAENGGVRQGDETDRGRQGNAGRETRGSPETGRTKPQGEDRRLPAGTDGRVAGEQGRIPIQRSRTGAPSGTNERGQEADPKLRWASLPATLRAAGIDSVSDFLYEVFEDKAAVESAMQMLNDNGIEGSIALLDQVRQPDVDHAVLSFMLQRIFLDNAAAVEATDPELARQYRERAREIGHRHATAAIKAGRFTRAASIISQSVEGVMYSIEKMIENDPDLRGRSLTPAEYARIEAAARRAEEAIAKVQSLESQRRDLLDKIATLEKQLKDKPRAERDKQSRKARVRVVKAVQERHLKDVDAIRERLREKLNSGTQKSVVAAEEPSAFKSVAPSPFDEQTLNDFAEVGAMMLTEGIARDVPYLPPHFRAEMVAEFGDPVLSAFDEIYRRSWERRDQWLNELRQEKLNDRVRRKYGEDLENWEVEEILAENKEKARTRRAVETLHRLSAIPEPTQNTLDGFIDQIAEGEDARIAKGVARQQSRHQLGATEADYIRGVETVKAAREARNASRAPEENPIAAQVERIKAGLRDARRTRTAEGVAQIRRASAALNSVNAVLDRLAKGPKPNTALEAVVQEIAPDPETAQAAVLMMRGLPPHQIGTAIGIVEAKAFRNAMRAAAALIEEAKKEHNIRRRNTQDEILRLKGYAGDIDDLRFRARQDKKLAQQHIQREIERITKGEARYWLRRTVSATHAMRTLMASFDLSGALRQGGFFAFAKPEAQGAMFGNMLKSIREKNYGQVIQEIEANPLFTLAQRSGVDFAAVGQPDLNYSQGEEVFRGEEFIESIPFLGKVVGATVTKPSERTYTAFLDTQRMVFFEMFANELMSRGLDPRRDEHEFKAIAKFVNVATGRGSIPSAMAMKVLKELPLFAPRYTLSRLQLLNTLNPVAYYNLPPATRRIVARSAARFYGTTMGLLGLAAAMGLTVNLDDDDDDFLKISAGNTKFDVFAGTLQPAKVIIKLVHSAIRTKGASDNRLPAEFWRDLGDGTWRYVRGKLDPVFSFAADYFSGSDYNGQQFSWGNAIGSRLMPLMWSDMYKAIQLDGWQGAAATMPAIFGIGTSTYPPHEERPETEAEKLAAKAARWGFTPRPKTAAEREAQNVVSKLVARARRADPTVQAEAKELRAQNVIDDDDLEQIGKAAGETLLQFKAKRLSLEVFERVWDLATSAERTSLKQIANNKLDNAIKNDDDLSAQEAARLRKKFGGNGVP